MGNISLATVYAGISSEVEAHDAVTVTLAEFAINTVPDYLAKRSAWLDTINIDVQNYLTASFKWGDESAPAEAAQWNEKKSTDTSAMNQDTNNLNALVENAKSDAQANEANMQAAVAMQEPINEYLKAFLNLIASGFR